MSSQQENVYEWPMRRGHVLACSFKGRSDRIGAQGQAAQSICKILHTHFVQKGEFEKDSIEGIYFALARAYRVAVHFFGIGRTDNFGKSHVPVSVKTENLKKLC